MLLHLIQFTLIYWTLIEPRYDYYDYQYDAEDDHAENVPLYRHYRPHVRLPYNHDLDYGQSVPVDRHQGYSIANYEMMGTDPSSPLCDDPVVHSADRMLNGTVRLYRGDYYWDLYGMPDRVGWLTPGQRIQIADFGPVVKRTKIMTCLQCNRKGHVFKFAPGKWWAWMASGQVWKADPNGNDFEYNKESFDAVFHNDIPEEPLMVGIKGRHVYYYSTKGYYIQPSPKYEIKGYVRGKHGENFPSGVHAGFSWPNPGAPDNGYYVFLFKGDKYCFRTNILSSGRDCDEWRQTRELFGCLK